MPVRVLVADPISEAGIQALRDRGLQVDVKTGLDPSALQKAIGEAEALVVRSSTHVDAALLKAARKLRVVGRAGVGVDNIDEEAATAHGVLVMNTPLGNTISACEHTWALMLALARNVARADASVRAGNWDRKAFGGTELAGKTLGVIGLGRIGREVAARARAFQMRVIGHDPFVNPEAAKRWNVELAEIDDLLTRCDVVTLHVPLSESTKNLVNAERLATMRPGAMLINVARGGLVDEDALATALKDGKLAGAALDVFAQEPPKDSPLLALDNVVVTPHLGASTREAQEKVAIQVAEQVADFLLEGRVRNATNLAHPPDPELQPWLALGEAMGGFAMQLADANPTALTVECRGEVGRLDSESVAWAAVAGILGRASADRVTLVNAPAQAQAFGMAVAFTKTQETQDYAASIRLTLKTAKGDVSLLGTHLARLGARLVEINGYDVEFKPTGRFLVVPHQDQPGTIAKISSLLGERNVNIAQMVVGRQAPRGAAISILRVDDPIPNEVVVLLRERLAAPGVRVVEVGAAGAE